MRQLTLSNAIRTIDTFSKLPMRQLTGSIYAIIIILLDLYQPPHRTQNLTLLSKLMINIGFRHPRKCKAYTKNPIANINLEISRNEILFYLNSIIHQKCGDE